MIKAYTTGCPKCRILEDKLNKANIEYEKITDIEIMKQKGFLAVPMIEVDGEIMDFNSAIKWINERK